MTAALLVAPNPATVNDTVNVDGSGLPAKTQYRLWREDPKYGRQGVTSNRGRIQRDGTIGVAISLSAYVGEQTVGCELSTDGGKTWAFAVSGKVTAQKTVVDPPPPPPPPPPGAKYPADGQLIFRSETAMPLPALGVDVPDAALGTTTRRVSNSPFRQTYSRTPAWNSNSTRILLGSTYPGLMLDAATYAPLPWPNSSSKQVYQASWSNTDPNKLYGVSGNQLIAQDATTGVRTVIYTFSSYLSISIGNDEGAIDDFDTYVALIAATASGTKRLITFDLVAKQPLADIAAPAGIGDCQISRKGTYVTAATGSGLMRYTRALTNPIVLYPFYSHGDNALDAAGEEIFVANHDENSSIGVKSYRLSDGTKTLLLPMKSIFDAGHVSGRNTNRPGWVYLSNYDPNYYGNPSNTYPGRDQVIALATDGSGTVEVFAFAHHSILTYENEPQAVPSRDGSRVLFASEWSTSGVYAFEARAT